MAINLERWKNQEDLTSQNFNKRLIELENQINNIISRLENENQQLKQRLNDKVERHILHKLKIKDLNNANFSYNYETDTSEGRQMGLPTDWAFIKFFKHSNNNGYCTQIAYKLASNCR